ncbi:MAG: DegV family protein [Clostridia bacterium]|nr:DegV family protein [Clostridia bacterium]
MVKILVDSSSDCKKEEGLFDYFVPISVTIDGKDYKDGVELDADTFYEILTSCGDFPHTAQPSIQDMVDIFEEVKEAGDELIYFALSSALSGTYQAACLAKEMADYDGIYIIDTKTATHMIGLLVSYARGRINEGASAKEIVEECEELKSKVRVLAGLDTLEYLRRGGRLGNASAVIGSLAKIKPIITVTEEGKVEAIGKGLGVGRAMQMVIEKLSDYELDDRFPLYAIYTYGTENVEDLKSRLHFAGYRVADTRQVGSTIGAHIGPEVYGIVFVVK